MVRVFSRLSGRFLLVVEAKPGTSNAAVGATLNVVPPARPDLQIESTHDMKSGTSPVDISVIDCQAATPIPRAQWGGIPGIPTPNFDSDTGPIPVIANTLVDFVTCHFGSFPINATNPFDKGACTSDDRGNPGQPVNGGTQQFCDQVLSPEAFPIGDSLLTVQVRDALGNIGPTAQIIVRVATPTPPPP
jgi:hypothetical protein